MEIPDHPFNMTQGVVLDPFSILVSGILRRNGNVRKTDIEDDLDWLHGEARFKQAFVNACHFAESVTLSGPVAQLRFEDFAGMLDFDENVVQHPDIMWPFQPSTPGNHGYTNEVIGFMRKHKLANAPEGHWRSDKNDQIPFLPLLPDLLFGYRDKLDDTDEFFAALYRHNFGMSKTKYDELTWKLRDNHRGLKHGSRPTSFYRGAPVAALMAVTFTFKKPTGTLATKELTNLGGWPPVTFLLPVLTPAGCEIDGYLSNPNLNRVIGQQPSIWSYKILNTKDQSIIPFGQPFTLTTVRAKGKDPDILRSLADVFKALWSQKAQYSALTTNVEHLDELGYGYATLNIDPMGQGRRIRGHNRYSGRFRVQDVRLLGEDLGNDAGMMDVHPDPSRVTKMLFRRQLRSQGEERHYRTIYMLPSFCKRMLEGNSTLPLLLTMHRHLLGDQRLTDFVDGRVHTRGDSFMNTLQANYGVGGVDEGQVGKIPTCRVPCALEFDPEGEPAVVGLSWSDEVMHDVQAAATPAEEVDIITTKTKKLTDFAHLDVLTSNSTSELTNTFGKVKKVEDDELVGADEDEGEGFIELFDSEEML